MALKPSTYTFRTDEYPQLTLPSDIHYGLLAGNVQELLPSLVKDAQVPGRVDMDGNITSEALNFQMVNYNEIIPVLVNAIQEQQVQIEALSQALQNCCNSSFTAPMQQQEALSSYGLKLSNQQQIVLNQNVPNPFKESTSIAYEVNVAFNNAQILFHDAQGKLVQTFDIVQNGKGTLNVFADDLTTGTYTYTLVVDGAIMSFNKMIKE